MHCIRRSIRQLAGIAAFSLVSLSAFAQSWRLLAGTAFLALVALPAIGQVLPQSLTIAFDVSIPAAPLSDWLTAGIALLLAASAIVAMRRQQSRTTRSLLAVVALVAGATMLSVAGRPLVDEANAVPGVQINLVTSPAVIDVSQFVPASPLTLTATNMTGKFAKITAITLANGAYVLSGGTCTVGLTLNPLGTCTVVIIGGA